MRNLFHFYNILAYYRAQDIIEYWSIELRGQTTNTEMIYPSHFNYLNKRFLANMDLILLVKWNMWKKVTNLTCFGPVSNYLKLKNENDSKPYTIILYFKSSSFIL